MKHYKKSLALLALGISILVAGCAHSVDRDATVSDPVFYPPPPEKPRIQYLTSFSQSTDITGKRSSFMTYLLGEETPVPIGKPYGIDIRDGKLYVCDTKAADVLILDLKEHTFDRLHPGGRAQLKKPINCFVDTTGRIYIADGGRRQIVVVDEDGKYIGEMGDVSEDMKLVDVAVDGGLVYATDMKNHQIKVYSAEDFKLVRAFPESQKGIDADLFSPVNLWVQDGRVYISDFGAFHIQVYSTAGEYLSTVGSYGRNLGEFVRPKGVAVDREGIMYVVDAGFENVQMFNRDGELLMFFGGTYSAPGDMWLPAKVTIDYDNVELFQDLVDPMFGLKYLIFVTNQFGPDKISVYGFLEEK